MEMDRRESLRLLRSALILSATSSFLPAPAWSAPRRGAQPAALLVPLTGPSAALGLSMRRAATLVESDEGRNADLIVFDTGGTPAGAAAAARLALRRRARLILGPLFAPEVRPVLDAVAGKVPVLSFSNDSALLESGAFLLGITPAQLTTAILHYARGRGIRRVALFTGNDGWGAQTAVAARALQGELGLDLRVLASDPPTPAALRAAAGGGELPDALLLSGGGASLLAAARAFKGSGVQLLGTMRAIDHSPSTLAALEGAWLASPDPAAFSEFARNYEMRHGGAPGAIAALAHDGAMIAKTLREGGRLDRPGLLATREFAGITGNLRFRSDGSCARELAILAVDANGYSVVEKSAAA